MLLLLLLAPFAALVLAVLAVRSRGLVRHMLIRWLLAPLLALLALPVLFYGERLNRWLEYNPATRERFEALIKSNDHQAVLAAAAGFITQARTNLVLLRPVDRLTLPPEIIQLHPSFVRVKEQELDVVYTDVRGKYGFCISRIPHGWQLAWCEMGEARLTSDWFLHPLATQNSAR